MSMFDISLRSLLFVIVHEFCESWVVYKSKVRITLGFYSVLSAMLMSGTTNPVDRNIERKLTRSTRVSES